MKVPAVDSELRRDSSLSARFVAALKCIQKISNLERSVIHVYGDLAETKERHAQDARLLVYTEPN
jgi:hypothetical protein